MFQMLRSLIFSLYFVGATCSAVSDAHFENVNAAMDSDDECRAADGPGCAVNALQVQGSTVTELLDLDLEEATSRAKECKASSHVCADYETYGQLDDCGAAEQCTVKQGETDATWLCVSADSSCPLSEGNSVNSVAVSDLQASINMAAGAKIVYYVKTLYHTTSPGVANAILASNFRPGRAGWCGGAIYFIAHPHLPHSKFGSRTQSGAIIQARVNMGNVCYFNSHCQGMYGTGVPAAKKQGCNSIIFNPGDGHEYVIWEPSQVLSKKRYQ